MSIARKLSRKEKKHVGKRVIPCGNRRERRGYLSNTTRAADGHKRLGISSF